MKNIIPVIFFIVFINQFYGQTYSELRWTKYYETVENKFMGIWPHDSRYEDL